MRIERSGSAIPKVAIPPAAKLPSAGAITTFKKDFETARAQRFTTGSFPFPSLRSDGALPASVRNALKILDAKLAKEAAENEADAPVRTVYRRKVDGKTLYLVEHAFDDYSEYRLLSSRGAVALQGKAVEDSVGGKLPAVTWK